MRRSNQQKEVSNQQPALSHVRNFLIIGIALCLACSWLASCSTTSAIPEGEQLYTGMKGTKYENYDRNEHFTSVQEELNVVLATKPNAALFGSPSLRSPFPVGLWIWNAFSPDTSAFSRWMVRVFGSKPVPVSYTHLTLPTKLEWCRSRWSPYH